MSRELGHWGEGQRAWSQQSENKISVGRKGFRARSRGQNSGEKAQSSGAPLEQQGQREYREDHAKGVFCKPPPSGAPGDRSGQSHCSQHTPPQRRTVEPTEPAEGHTLLSSFFMVTRSRDLRECPVGVMK